MSESTTNSILHTTDGHVIGRTALLSSAYFPPVQWMQKLHIYNKVYVERNDNFCKQTYRNRCVIATANGVQALTVPIERFEGAKCPMRDIRISDHGEWRHLHWNAIVSAYGESPFFDYYADDLRPFFERKWKYLFDFNMEIVDKLCELLDVRPNISLTDSYADAALLGADDLRDVIRPKHPAADPLFAPRPYYQVYASRHGFQSNMSVLDLLCNEGPEGIFYL
ncbi:WbqC family protein [Prevotella sp.]|uniref:WbqC family protein n=1 Tax=Prevotella sp. TaxID=59823 RepID=UPI003FEEF3DB